jgi:hypothetical protein
MASWSDNPQNIKGNFSSAPPNGGGELPHVPLTEAELAKRRSGSLEKRTRNRRLAGIGLLGTVAVAAGALAFVKVNEAIDRVDGVSPEQLAQLANVKPNPNIKFVKFTFKAERDNGLDAAIKKFAPDEDRTKSQEDLSTYLPEYEQKSKIVHPGEEITFAVNTETHEIIPKDRAPTLPSAEQGQ